MVTPLRGPGATCTSAWGRLRPSSSPVFAPLARAEGHVYIVGVHTISRAASVLERDRVCRRPSSGPRAVYCRACMRAVLSQPGGPSGQPGVASSAAWGPSVPFKHCLVGVGLWKPGAHTWEPGRPSSAPTRIFFCASYLYLHVNEFASYVLLCPLSDSTHKRCCPRGSARREHPTHSCIVACCIHTCSTRSPNGYMRNHLAQDAVGEKLTTAIFITFVLAW